MFCLLFGKLRFRQKFKSEQALSLIEWTRKIITKLTQPSKPGRKFKLLKLRFCKFLGLIQTKTQELGSFGAIFATHYCKSHLEAVFAVF